MQRRGQERCAELVWPWALACVLVLLPWQPLDAQMIDRPDTVWGQVDHQPEGLVVGSVETLAGSLLAQLLTLASVVALVLRRRALIDKIRRVDGVETHRLGVGLGRVHSLLAVVAYGLSPLLATTSIVLGGPHAVAGLHAPVIAMALFAATCVVVAVDLLRPTVSATR